MRLLYLKANKMSNDKQSLTQPNRWVGYLKELLIFSLIAVVFSLIVDRWRGESIISGKAPILSTQSLSGDRLDLIAMSKDEPVLIYFWATWCGVCNTVSPSVDFIAQHYQVISVALNSGESNRIKQYLNAKEYTFNVVNDPTGEIGRQWGVSVTPTIFIIDNGNISTVTTGFTSPIGMWLRLLFS